MLSKPYHGKKPYCFVSCAHADFVRVKTYVEEMQGRRVRLWFDEGSDPNSEWVETVADQIDNCAFFIVFVSVNSLATTIVRREVYYAVSKRKRILCLYLEDCEMSAGMHLQLDASQAVYLDRYQSPSEVVDRLCEVLPSGVVAMPREDERAKKRKRLMILGVVCCALVVCAVAAALCVYAGVLHLPSAIDEASEEMDRDTHTLVTLSAKDGLTYAQISTCVEMLQNRLDTWLGQGGYLLDWQGGTVYLSIPNDEGADIQVLRGGQRGSGGLPLEVQARGRGCHGGCRRGHPPAETVQLIRRFYTRHRGQHMEKDQEERLTALLDEFDCLGVGRQVGFEKHNLYSIITHSTAIEGIPSRLACICAGSAEGGFAYPPASTKATPRSRCLSSSAMDTRTRSSTRHQLCV